jgi:subtilisin-like proprotein convertase family protein
VKVTLIGFAHGYPQDVSALLVSPNGQKALLMRRAGGYSSVTNLTLTFDQNASTAIPQSSLASGIYKPMDYTTGGPYTFPSPAPAGPYNVDLTKLNNTVAGSADGNWSLYVTDDTPSDAGIITGGWSLAITTGPVIQGLQNISTAENSPARVPFTIADDTVDTPSYTFSYSSTNTLLVASSGAVTFSGSGTNYVMTINPVQYASGTTKITVNATNQDGQTATASFILTVTPVNFPPTMTAVADQTIEAGSTVSVPFVYNDIETPQKNLIFTIDSSNPSLLPVSNITSSDDYLHIAPAGALTGSSRVTLTVAEPAADGGLSTHESFLVTVIAGATPVFGNTNAITINDDAAATPYPSTIDVSNVVGHVADVSVTLVGFGHTFPSDASALLVGPQGQKVVLMSRAGGGVSVSNVRLTLDDNATNSLPQNTGLTNGTFKPSSYESGLTFPTPAPVTPYSTQLSAFSGTSPNGTWSLYVQDDVPTFGGQITGGWILHIITDTPAIAPIQGQVTDENTPLVVPFTLISPVTSPDNLTLFATSSANNPPDLIPAGNLVLGGSGTNRTVTITPTANEYGTSLITLSVTDGINRSSTSFPLTVNFVNQPPTITGLSDQTLAANQVLQLPFRVSDAETPASNLVVNATSSDSSIGTVAVSGTDTARTLIFRPSGTQGSTTLSVTAFDGQLTTTNSLVVTVTPAVFPTIAPIADQTIYEGNTLLVNVSISNTTATNLVVAGSSSNSNLVASVTIGGSGTSRTALVTLVPYANSDQFGPAVITITATDQNGTGSTSFNLNVIAVNNPPVLGRIAEQGTTMNTPLRLPLVVSDPDTPLKDLSFVGSSSNPSLVSGVTFQNSGSNVVAIITPATNQTGTASITIAVNDGTTTVSQSFNLTVTAPPVLGPIADQTATLGASVSIPLVVSDADTPLTNLTFTASGYSGPLVQTVTFAKTASNVVATVTAATNRFGTTPITISASDGTSTASQTFTFTVSVAPVLGPIADQHTTMDTPLTLKLDVSDIETALTNLTFTGTPDTYALVSGVTFQNDGTNVTATITPVTGRFGTAAITIAVSDGTTTVSQNFNLTITAPPVLAAIPDQTTPLNVPLTLTLTVSDFDTPLTNLTFTGQAGSTALVTGISFSNNGKKVTTIITPAANRHGTTTVTINVSDGTSTTSQTFNLSITAPPTLGPIAAQTTVTNVPVSVKLDVSDADTPISDLAFTGVATDTNLVKGISFTNDGTNVVATITPSATQTGSTTVTISVSDGTSAFSQNFTFTVGTASPPSLKPSLNLSNGSLGIGFTGVPNATYVLQSSSDLVTWTTVATATADATGAVNFNVTIDTSTPFQFYRVRSQ